MFNEEFQNIRRLFINWAESIISVWSYFISAHVFIAKEMNVVIEIFWIIQLLMVCVLDNLFVFERKSE